MNCLEFRRLSLIDPLSETPAQVTHRASCAQCARYAEQLVAQDELIREATRIEVPEGFAARILLNQSLQQQPRRPTRKYWLSLAASILIAAVILPPAIQDAVFAPLESGLITHVRKHEVLSLDPHTEHADHASEFGEIQKVFASIGAEMPVESDNIIYASTCVVDGQVMAHLMMKDGDEEYVVFLMPEQSFARNFTQDEWIGQIVHTGGGSLAVLNKRGIGLDNAAARFSNQFSQNLTLTQRI